MRAAYPGLLVRSNTTAYLASGSGTGSAAAPTGSIINSTNITTSSCSPHPTSYTAIMSSTISSYSAIPTVVSPVPAGISLNYSLPAGWTTDITPPLISLLSISLFIGYFSGPVLQFSEKISDTIAHVANLYISTNGTASYAQLGSVLQTTEDNVALLIRNVSLGVYMQGTRVAEDQDFAQLTLWANRYLQTGVSGLEPDELSTRDEQPAHVYPPMYRTTKDTLSLVIVFMAISILTTAGRLWSRWRHGGHVGLWVDGLFVVGVISGLLVSGIFGNGVVLIADQGAGAVWGITFAAIRTIQMESGLVDILYHSAVGFIKASILCFYYSMTPVRWQRWTILFILFVCCINNLLGFFFQIFKNHPIDWWNYLVTRTLSPLDAKFTFAVGIVNIATDIIIWVMPVPWILQVTRDRRTQVISVAIVFSSALSCIFATLRAVHVWRGNVASENGSLSQWSVALYALIEIHLMIWCYNIPALRVLLAKKRERPQTYMQSPTDTFTSDITGGKGDASTVQFSTKGRQGWWRTWPAQMRGPGRRRSEGEGDVDGEEMQTVRYVDLVGKWEPRGLGEGRDDF